jgi:SAM-dependent methyltransferase
MKIKLRITANKNVFDEMGIFWAEIADQRQTERQVEFLRNILQSKGLVLDLACGTGRHLIALGKEGYGVVGLDISLKLLRIAKSRWPEAQVVQGDMQFLPFKPQAFAAAVSMDQSLGYLPSEQDDIKSLSEVHGALGKDGVLIVDLFNRERFIKQSKASSQPKWREYPSFFLQQTRTVEANDERLHDSWVVRDKTDQQQFFKHVARLYKKESLQGMLEKAGFKMQAVYGDYEGQSFSADSSRLILVSGSTSL